MTAKDHAGGVPPTRIREAKQGGLDTPEDTAKPSHNQAVNPHSYANITGSTGIRVNVFAGDTELDKSLRILTAAVTRVDEAVTDLANTSPNANTDLSNPQLRAEYKQLLNELPEKRSTEFKGKVEGMGYQPYMENNEAMAQANAGYNEALDQCQANIEARIKGLDHTDT